MVLLTGMRIEKKAAQRGFSLVEVIVVTAIMLILSSLFIGFNRTSGKNLLLYTQEVKVVGILEEAKSLALQRLKKDNPNENIRVCAYGVSFVMGGSYSVFRVTKNVENTTCPVNVPGARETVSTHQLDSGVYFTTLPTGGWVAFTAPYLETENGGTIKMKITGLPYEKTIEISAGGSISAK